MEVGLHYRLRNPPYKEMFRPWKEFYAEFLDHATEMERLGFHSINVGEHHGDPGGYNPSPLIMMTALAMKTKQVKIGQNVLQLPFYHPVKIAEDLATIDILSNGRVTLSAGQVGRGFDDEFAAFGINPKERPSRLEEGMEVIRRCWTEDVFSFSGKRWTLRNVRINPKPVQQPHPPMSVVANSAASMDRAARLGFHACGGGGGFQFGLGAKADWRSWSARWKLALQKYGRLGDDLRVNTFGVCFATDDPEREWAKHRIAIWEAFTYRRFSGTQPYLHLFRGPPPETPEDLPGWRNYFRTPADLVLHLKDAFGDSAPNELLLSADWPGIPLADTLQYLTTFARQVMPRLHDLPP